MMEVSDNKIKSDSKCLICLDQLSEMGVPTIQLIPCTHTLWYSLHLIPNFPIVNHVSCSTIKRARRKSAQPASN